MEPADSAAAEEFARGLPDHPFTFGPRCILLRGLGRAWIHRSVDRPSAAVVVAPWLEAEPAAFGSDAETIWSLLKEIPGWTCVNLDSETAPDLAKVIERELRTSTRLSADVYYVLDRPPIPHTHPAVRRLTEDDLELVEAAPEPLRPVAYLSTLSALTGGVVAGGIVDARLVASISMSVSSEEYADLGGHTLEPWRNQGMASAAGYLVALELRARGLTPVWSTGEDNVRSQRVASKLGFREFGRETYVVVPALQAAGGFHPP